MTSSEKTVRAGVVGYGLAGAIFHAPLIGHMPGMSLSGVSTSQPDKLKADWPETQAFSTPHALIQNPDIDLIVIASPNQTHYPLAAEALETGKHVVIDKPFALSTDEARDLMRRADARNLLLSVFHNRRWDADFRTLKALLASGELGRICHFESHFDRHRPLIRQGWREVAGPGAGLWVDLGSHLLDQALQLFGKPDSLALDLAQQRDESQCDDWFHCLLHYGEMRVILHAGVLSAAATPRFAVHGTKGSYVKFGLDPQEAALRDGERPEADHTDWGIDTQPGTLTLGEPQPLTREWPSLQGDWRLYYQGIRDAILNGAPSPVPAAEALEVVRLIELGYQSHVEGRRIAV